MNTLNCFLSRFYLPGGWKPSASSWKMILRHISAVWTIKSCPSAHKKALARIISVFKSNEGGGIATSTTPKVCIAVTVKCSRNVCFELVGKKSRELNLQKHRIYIFLTFTQLFKVRIQFKRFVKVDEYSRGSDHFFGPSYDVHCYLHNGKLFQFSMI